MTELNTTHILLVDNDDGFLCATADLLCQQGYVCDGVTGAAQTIAAMQAHPYDVLITNIGIYGYQEIELLHTSYRSQPWVSTIVVVDSPSLHTAVEALRLSVVDYLIKPVDPPTLLRSVCLALEAKRRRQAVQNARAKLLAQFETLERPVQETIESSWTLQDYIVQAAGHIARMARDHPPSLNILLLPPMVCESLLEGATTLGTPESQRVMTVDDVPLSSRVYEADMAVKR